MSNWYYSSNGQQFGPVGTDELKSKLGSELPSDTLVWKEGMENWSPASSVTELTFTPQQPISYAPPQNPIHSQAAMQTAGAVSAAAVNPYAAPVSNLFQEQGMDYPMPYVKPANYGLYLGLLLGGILVAFIGIMMVGIFSEADAAVPSVGGLLILMSGAGLACWGGILGLIYVHRAWTVLQPAGASTTPGKAVGFLFIPFFNIYWAFVAYWKWAKEWNEAKPRYTTLHHAPQGAEGVFLGSAICQCVSIVIGAAGFVQGILHLIGMKSMCDVINFAHQNSNERPRF